MNRHLSVTALLAIACCAALLASESQARIVVFRNDAGIPIRFSLRAVSAASPVTQVLNVNQKVQFDLQENKRFDFCGVGLDALNGTFGVTNVDIFRLLASSRTNEIGVDGTIDLARVCECGRWVCRQRRTAILLVFPATDGQDEIVVTAGRVCADYANWFYYDSNPREPIANPALPSPLVTAKEAPGPFQSSELRTWTNSGGNRAEARLVQVEGHFAYFERADGKLARSPVANLSAADQEWIGDWLVSTTGAPGHEAGLPKPVGAKPDKQARL